MLREYVLVHWDGLVGCKGHRGTSRTCIWAYLRSCEVHLSWMSCHGNKKMHVKFPYVNFVLQPTHELYGLWCWCDISMYKVTPCRAPFSGWKVKDQGHTGSFKFWPCGFVSIWLNHFICGVHTTYEGTMCHAPFSGWKVKVTWAVQSFYLVHSMGSSLFDRIISYVAYMYLQHIKGQCVSHHFKNEGSKLKVTQVISPIFVVSALWLHCTVWETKFWGHSPENRCPLYVPYKIPLARANFRIVSRARDGGFLPN